jgi:hypothetical protein
MSCETVSWKMTMSDTRRALPVWNAERAVPGTGGRAPAGEEAILRRQRGGGGGGTAGARERGQAQGLAAGHPPGQWSFRR